MSPRGNILRRFRRGLSAPAIPRAPQELVPTHRDPRGQGLILALILAAMAFFWLAVRPLIAPLVLAALTAVLFEPIHRRLEARLGVATNRAALASILLLLVFFGGPAVGFAMLFVAQARTVLGDFLGLSAGQTIASRLAQLINQYIEWLEALDARYLGRVLDLSAIGMERAQDFGAAVYERLPDFLAYGASLVFAYLIFTVALFFLLRDWRAIVDLVLECAPIEPSHTLQILIRVRETIRAVFLGSVLTAVFQGSLAALAFLLTGFPNFAVWGALTAMASFVPVVGTALVWGPATVFLLTNGDLPRGLMLLAFGIFISTTDNMLRLLFLGVRMAVHPLVLFVAVFGGLTAVGPMGVVYGPLLAACLFEALAIYREHLRSAQSDDPPAKASPDPQTAHSEPSPEPRSPTPDAPAS